MFHRQRTLKDLRHLTNHLRDLINHLAFRKPWMRRENPKQLLKRL